MHILSLTHKLTFASRFALAPRVIKLRVPATSTLVEPSTTMSATTARAGSQEDAALGAYSTDCLGDRLRRDGRSGHGGRDGRGCRGGRGGRDERRRVRWG